MQGSLQLVTLNDFDAERPEACAKEIRCHCTAKIQISKGDMLRYQNGGVPGFGMLPPSSA